MCNKNLSNADVMHREFEQIVWNHRSCLFGCGWLCTLNIRWHCLTFIKPNFSFYDHWIKSSKLLFQDFAYRYEFLHEYRRVLTCSWNRRNIMERYFLQIQEKRKKLWWYLFVILYQLSINISLNVSFVAKLGYKSDNTRPYPTCLYFTCFI